MQNDLGDIKMEKTSGSNRLPIFDGLKGLAIIAVLAYYFFEHILPGGFLAVNTFLFIAGFFNFRHFYMKDLQGRKPAYGKFLLKRFERLFFPMLSVIILTITYILFFARDYLNNIFEMGLSSLLFLNNYYQIFNQQSYFVQAANPSPFTHFWYVSLYGQLILLMPILIILFYSWHKKPQTSMNMLLILSLVSAALLGYLYVPNEDPTRIYYSLVTRMSAFTFGGAIGLAFPAKLAPRPIKRKYTLIMDVAGLVAFISAFLMLKFMFGTQPFAYRFGLTLFSIVTMLLVVTSVHPSTIWNKIYSFKLFTFIGKRSFSYYLWFYPVYLLFPQNVRFLNQTPWLNYGVQFILIALLAEMTYQLFEKQSISLPFGQDFNYKKTKYQLNFLREHPHQLNGIKILSGVYIFLFVMAGIGLAVGSQTSGNEQAEELQTTIQSNIELAEQTRDTSQETPKVVNNIEGLGQEILLYANGLDVSFIGDSTLAAAANRIWDVFPKAIIDPQEGRQLYNSYNVVNNLEVNNQLMPTVVTMLGTNGTFTSGQLNDYIEAVGSDKDQFFVTVSVDKPWTNDANRQLTNAAQRYGNVKIIDWANYANDHSEWFAADGYHLNDEGAKELAKFIAEEIYRQR